MEESLSELRCTEAGWTLKMVYVPPYIGDKLIPPLIGNPYNGYVNPYYWVDDIPYYMERMGV